MARCSLVPVSKRQHTQCQYGPSQSTNSSTQYVNSGHRIVRMCRKVHRRYVSAGHRIAKVWDHTQQSLAFPSSPHQPGSSSIRYVSTGHRGAHTAAYAMSVPDIASHTLRQYQTSHRIRYVSPGHRVAYATSVPDMA
eukprot:1321328-Rhodomonas_salina.1